PEGAAGPTAELFRGLAAKNGWPGEAVRPQCRRRPLDTGPGGGGPSAEAKWFPRSCRAENGGTRLRPGSVPARKSSPALAPRATRIPSVRGLRRRRRNENNAGLRIDLHGSSRVAYARIGGSARATGWRRPTARDRSNSSARGL